MRIHFGSDIHRINRILANLTSSCATLNSTNEEMKEKKGRSVWRTLKDHLGALFIAIILGGLWGLNFGTFLFGLNESNSWVVSTFQWLIMVGFGLAYGSTVFFLGSFFLIKLSEIHLKFANESRKKISTNLALTVSYLGSFSGLVLKGRSLLSEDLVPSRGLAFFELSFASALGWLAGLLPLIIVAIPRIFGQLPLPQNKERAFALIAQGIKDRTLGISLDLQNPILKSLELCEKLRELVTPPKGTEKDWIDPSFREECFQMIHNSANSLEALSHKWRVWEEKNIPSEKTHDILRQDQKILLNFNSELQKILSNAQDLVLSKSPDWSRSLEAVKKCRKYGEIWKESPVI